MMIKYFIRQNDMQSATNIDYSTNELSTWSRFTMGRETRKFVKEQFVTYRIIFPDTRGYQCAGAIYTEQLVQLDTSAKHFHLAELSTTLRFAA